MNAHYNAHFLAKQRLNEAEKVLFNSRKDDYNEMLEVLISHDTTRAGAVKAQTEYAVQKASLPIQHHKNSHWLDDCYLELARARFLQADFGNAVETYKYVNSESQDDKLRHHAMIGLLRCFTELNNQDYAAAVISRLRREKLSKHDLVAFYEARARYHQARQEYDQTLAILKQTVKRMRPSERRARLYYIVGQLYQRNNRVKEAYGNFEKVLKSNASYELALQARLQMIQLYSGDEKKLLKKFNKTLNDEKNKEYQGRILYAMGMYELRKERYEKAAETFRKAAAAPDNDSRQKALAFLRLAEMYYDKKQDYASAKNYYDSTLNAGLSRTTPNYATVVKRQKVLSDFVRHYTVIQTEDSLQRLAKMDAAARDKVFDEVLNKKEKAEREAERRKTEQMAEEVGAIFNNLNPEQNNNSRRNNDDANWYFGNQTAMAQGRTSFSRKWGDRPLADNWRRSQRGASFDEPQPGNAPATPRPVVARQPEKPSREDQKKAMLATLPLGEDAMKKSDEKLEEAYYELGKILDKELLEKPNAVKNYDTLLERFPETEHAAEVLYALFLIHQEAGDERQEAVKNRLVSQYGNTMYAKLAQNPNYTRDENLADIQADRAFQEAYQLYEAQNFAEADQLIQSGLQQYAGTFTEQRLKVLQIKIIGKTQGAEAYRRALEEFVAAYPQSPLLSYVQNLLRKTTNLSSNK